MFRLKTHNQPIYPNFQILLGVRDSDDSVVAASLRGLADLVPIMGGDVVVGAARKPFFFHGLPKVCEQERQTDDQQSKVGVCRCEQETQTDDQQSKVGVCRCDQETQTDDQQSKVGVCRCEQERQTDDQQSKVGVCRCEQERQTDDQQSKVGVCRCEQETDR